MPTSQSPPLSSSPLLLLKQGGHRAQPGPDEELAEGDTLEIVVAVGGG